MVGRAAYKGFADTIRLLLFRDSDQGRQDKDGRQHFLISLMLMLICLSFFLARLHELLIPFCRKLSDTCIIYI